MRPILTILLVSFLTVWAQAASKPATPAPHAATRSAASDAEVERTIRAKFAKSKINADGFTVKVQGGVATIEGKTSVVQHKGVATRMAKTGGATAVVNKVQISDAARQKLVSQLNKGKVAQVKP